MIDTTNNQNSKQDPNQDLNQDPKQDLKQDLNQDLKQEKPLTNNQKQHQGKKRKQQRTQRPSQTGTKRAIEVKAPVEKNDVLETRVAGQGNSGEGILRIEEFPLFIPGVLTGELIRAKVTKVNAGHGFARLEEMLEPSPERQTPPCPYYGRCGGCNLQHQTYAGQLRFKTDRVRDCFIRIGGFENPEVLPAIGMDNPWRYRNKVQMPIGISEGDVKVGFYRGRSHEIIDINECLIQNEASDLVADCVRNWIKTYDIPILEKEEVINPGVVRHLLIREGRYTNEIMVVLVATSTDILYLDELQESLQTKVPNLTGLILNINNAVTNRVLGGTNLTVWGRDYIIDTIGELKYRISPHSFFQVNPEQTKVMYDTILKLAEFTGNEIILDLYCGAGSIALYMAEHVGHVTGVEIVPEAIADANYNMALNQISNANFILGKSEEVIEQLMVRGSKPDVVIVDPPRKGCDESLLTAIGESGIPKLIYMSCDSATLARDAAILKNYGFEPQTIQPVDNFPQTHHVEVCCLFCRSIQ